MRASLAFTVASAFFLAAASAASLPEGSRMHRLPVSRRSGHLDMRSAGRHARRDASHFVERKNESDCYGEDDDEDQGSDGYNSDEDDNEGSDSSSGSSSKTSSTSSYKASSSSQSKKSGSSQSSGGSDSSNGSSSYDGSGSSGSSDSSIPSILQGQLSGKATFYNQGGAAGSCGVTHSDSDKVIAVKEGVMTSALCGKQVTIKNTANGKSTTATIADTCPGCDGQKSIDLSVAAFNAIGNPSTGVLPIDWSILS